MTGTTALDALNNMPRESLQTIKAFRQRLLFSGAHKKKALKNAVLCS